MAVRELLKMGDARLQRIARPVDVLPCKEIDALLDDMFDTMLKAGGVGLAAPQIGVDLRVVVFGFDNSDRYPGVDPVPQTILINPVIEVIDAVEEEAWEGCLSVPGMRGLVPRPRAVRYRGCDQHGQPLERSVEGFHARVVLHECDHLDGVIYPQRIRDLTNFGFESTGIGENRQQ